MVGFVRIQFLLGKIDENKVLSYVPKWITAEEAETIIND